MGQPEAARPPAAPGLLLLLLLLVLSPPLQVGSAAPRIARSFQEVERVARRFSHRSVSNYSVFQADPSSRTLYVGAKDAIFALHLEDISLQAKMISWTVPEHLQSSCTGKGKTESECHNFVRILEFANRTHLLVCGTFAFNPQCGYIDVSRFHGVEGLESGRGRCPFEPWQPSTAVMADGVLYAATVNNFLGTEPIISRATGSLGEQIRTETSVMWLNEPEFVASAFLREGEDGEDDKVYFFFTETAREYDSYEKVKVARVARVCKGDLGGQKTLQRKWTTFLKTRLVCSDPESGVVFNLLQDMVTLPAQDWNATLFYGVFAAQRKEEKGSAVCAYSVAAVERAMGGRFKEFKRDCGKWTSEMQADVPDPRPGACVTSSLKQKGVGSSLALPDRVLTFVRDHPLMAEPIQPLENQPLLVQPDTQYRRLAVHRVRGLSGQEHHQLFLGTEDGHVHKAVKTGPRASLLEDLALFAEPQPVQSLQLYQNWLYVASDRGVTQIRTSSCARYETCQDCILSRDPSCAWAREQRLCRDHGGQAGLIQDVTAEKVLALCPVEDNGLPAVVEVPVLLSARVVLPCRPQSAWSRCEWQKPSQDAAAAAAAAYLVRRDGLELTVAEATLGEYTCRCVESGVGGVVASYSLVRAGHGGPHAARGAERSYSVLVGVLGFVLGLALGSGCLLWHEWRRRERLQRELLCRERTGLDLLPSTATSCSHEPQTPSSPEDERHPLATAKKNGALNGYPHLYIHELEPEQARIYLAGAPLAKCDETSI
ncbi:semaphorin-4F [Hemicordylus capensis]|uniref:semaphorin-4F n=1 Tax=Hemicordylus capensis TaxID=884348 RepID=UPI0023031DD8|nr:semaphorin-4F [Hemicordylus capensis]